MEINNLLPDLDYPQATKATVVGKKIIFVTLGVDNSPNDPTTDDGMGQIISFSTRHNNRAKIEEGWEELRTNPDAVPLSYFEHGNCIWSVAGDEPRGTEGDWRWDGVDLAGVWVPDKYVIESYTPETHGDRREWFKKQAESTCEVYTQYCNGEVYGYSIEVYDYRAPYDELNDYRYDTATFEDSCWGYYGDEFLKQEVLSVLKSELEPEGKEVVTS